MIEREVLEIPTGFRYIAYMKLELDHLGQPVEDNEASGTHDRCSFLIG